MADNNRIIDLNKKPDDSNVPVKIDMSHKDGVVQILFDPAILRMRLRPREARSLAIAMLTHAELAENPPPIIEVPGE